MRNALAAAIAAVILPLAAIAAEPPKLVEAMTFISAMPAPAIEPRSVQLNLMSAAEMAKTCTRHGHRANCQGMAAWDHEFRQCIIWIATPINPAVLDHELRHCQEGHFHE